MCVCVALRLHKFVALAAAILKCSSSFMLVATARQAPYLVYSRGECEGQSRASE